MQSTDALQAVVYSGHLPQTSACQIVELDARCSGDLLSREISQSFQRTNLTYICTLLLAALSLPALLTYGTLVGWLRVMH